MATKKSPLGKGIEALIPIMDIDEAEDDNKQVMEIDINLIEPNDNQPRKKFDEEKLDQLADSIKEHGVVQPVIVKKEGETYKIIAGERRWRAARIAKLKTIPAIVKELTEQEVMEISLIENIQREDLNAIEEALAYKTLVEDFNLKQEEIAEKVGKSRSAVANVLRLLDLDDRVKSYLIDGIITEGHGRALLAVTNKELQYELAKKVIDENLNVRQTEQFAKRIMTSNKKTKKTTTTKKTLFIEEYRERLTHVLGTKVNIKQGKDKGKIEIEYYSLDDLERIMDLFNE